MFSLSVLDSFELDNDVIATIHSGQATNKQTKNEHYDNSQHQRLLTFARTSSSPTAETNTESRSLTQQLEPILGTDSEPHPHQPAKDESFPSILTTGSPLQDHEITRTTNASSLTASHHRPLFLAAAAQDHEKWPVDRSSRRHTWLPPRRRRARDSDPRSREPARAAACRALRARTRSSRR